MFDQLVDLYLYMPRTDSVTCSCILLPTPLGPPHLGTATLVVVGSGVAPLKCIWLWILATIYLKLEESVYWAPDTVQVPIREEKFSSNLKALK